MQKLSVSNRNRQLLICVESISLFSLERGGLPTDRPAKPLRLDDVEGVGSGDRELVHILHHQRQQLCAALDLDDLCNRFLIVSQDRKQRILRAGNRHVRIIRQCIRIDQQHTILHAEHVLFAHVRQDHVHGEVAVSQRLLVHDNGHIVKQHGRGEGLDHVAGRFGGSGEIGVSMAQLLRGGQIFVAPRTGLRLIPQLLQCIGAQKPCIGVRRVGKDDGICDLGDPLIFTLVKIRLCHLQDIVNIPQVLHPFFCAVAWHEGVQVDRVAVIPAHELLVDRLGVVGDRPVVLAGVPDFIECLRQLDHVGDLIAGVALIDIGQSLVVDELIHGSRVDHVVVHHVVSPVRPVVGLEGDLRVLAVKGNGLGDIACPCRAVAHLRAAQRVEIVERAGAG